MRQRCETPVKRPANPAWLNRRICGLALSRSAHQLDQSPRVKFAAQAAAGPTTEQVITTTENLATAARSLSATPATNSLAAQSISFSPDSTGRCTGIGSGGRHRFGRVAISLQRHGWTLDPGIVVIEQSPCCVGDQEVVSGVSGGRLDASCGIHGVTDNGEVDSAAAADRARDDSPRCRRRCAAHRDGGGSFRRSRGRRRPHDLHSRVGGLGHRTLRGVHPR